MKSSSTNMSTKTEMKLNPKSELRSIDMHLSEQNTN